MGHFAKINSENIVEQVVVINNEDFNNLEFPESEKIGQDFIKNIGLEGNFKQTSYNNNFRYYYAGIGYTFDPDFGEHGAFVPPKPYASWTLNKNLVWKAPTEYPDDGLEYIWNEKNQNWEKI